MAIHKDPATPDVLYNAYTAVAKHALAQAGFGIVEEGWERYGDIGKNDWEKVRARILELLPELAKDEFGVAYKLLAERAVGTDAS